jgi:hypothetical protein
MLHRSSDLETRVGSAIYADRGETNTKHTAQLHKKKQHKVVRIFSASVIVDVEF